MSTITEILSGQKGLAGVQQLLSPLSIEPFLENMLEKPGALQACHLRRAKFKPNRKVTAYYDLEINDSSSQSESNVTRSLAATWTLPDAPQTLATAEGALGDEIACRGLMEPFHQLISVEQVANLHIQVAPLDPVYPQLARLADPTYVGKMLGDSTAAYSDWTVTPIRYRPRQRHVLRYDSRDNYVGASHSKGEGAASISSRQKTFFAKLYPDTSRQHFYTFSCELADWFGGVMPDATVLRPLAYLPDDMTILYAEASGRPLSDSLGNVGCTTVDDTEKRTLAKNLRQTGAALRTLHGAPASLTTSLPSLDLTTEIKAVARTCEHIQALLPDVGQQISALLACIAESYASLPQEAPTFIHGDFKADHVLATNDQLTLIDFDSCALADPAYDIGKFLADLAWWYGSAQELTQSPGPSSDLAQARNAFLDGYDLPATHPRLHRAHIWAALIGIKIIAHRVRIFDANWAARTAAGVMRVAKTV